MAEKNMKARIVHKHDIEANWLKAANFIPMKGEIIVYDIDKNYNYERIKIGDGETAVSSLPFSVEAISNDIIDAICGGNLTVDITENVLVDTVTGDTYRLYIENGKLSMKQTDTTSDVTELVFIDDSTGIMYKVYVEDGKLHMVEVE